MEKQHHEDMQQMTEREHEFRFATHEKVDHKQEADHEELVYQ